VHQYYQELFRDGECFIHIVSLLNGVLDTENGEKLVLDVLQTLTSLLANDDASKVLISCEFKYIKEGNSCGPCGFIYFLILCFACCSSMQMHVFLSGDL